MLGAQRGGRAKLAVLRSGVGKALPSVLSPKINFVWASSFSLPYKQAAHFRGPAPFPSRSLRSLSLWGPSERASPQTRAPLDRAVLTLSAAQGPSSRPCSGECWGQAAPREDGRGLGSRVSPRSREARGVPRRSQPAVRQSFSERPPRARRVLYGAALHGDRERSASAPPLLQEQRG